MNKQIRLHLRKAHAFYPVTTALSTCLSLLVSTVPSLTPLVNAQATKWSSGFYKYTNQDTVIYLDPDKKTLCNIANDDQLWTYGGRNIVTTVLPDANISFERTSRGFCRWPNGFYKENNSNEVVHLFRRNGSYLTCIVGTEDVLRRLRGDTQIRVVAPNSQLGAERKSDGQCKI